MKVIYSIVLLQVVTCYIEMFNVFGLPVSYTTLLNACKLDVVTKLIYKGQTALTVHT